MLEVRIIIAIERVFSYFHILVCSRAYVCIASYHIISIQYTYYQPITFKKKKNYFQLTLI